VLKTEFLQSRSDRRKVVSRSGVGPRFLPVSGYQTTAILVNALGPAIAFELDEGGLLFTRRGRHGNPDRKSTIAERVQHAICE
jgi:hypothetical protein